MAWRHKLRGFMCYLVVALLALAALSARAEARPPGPTVAETGPFAVKFRDVTSQDRVRMLMALPGDTVTFEVADCEPGACYVARPAAGRIVPLGTARWVWTAPLSPGFYPIQVVSPGEGDSVTLQAMVAVPYDQLQGELLNGYRIGQYPSESFRGLSGYEPPAGFVEVTPTIEEIYVSPHFQLKQFLCKQPADALKYVVLNERLLLALEYVLELANEAGYQATTFHVMSGYRTPAYNRSLGNVRYSQHQWGAAADIFIDENGDGVMDDLNGDGLSDVRDADVLHGLIDAAAGRPDSQGLIGGLGRYPTTAAHGPFVHVDVRGRKARW